MERSVAGSQKCKEPGFFNARLVYRLTIGLTKYPLQEFGPTREGAIPSTGRLPSADGLCFILSFSSRLGAKTEGGGPGEAKPRAPGKLKARSATGVGRRCSREAEALNVGGRVCELWLLLQLRQGGTRSPAPTVPLQRDARGILLSSRAAESRHQRLRAKRTRTESRSHRAVYRGRRAKAAATGLGRDLQTLVTARRYVRKATCV